MRALVIGVDPARRAAIAEDARARGHDVAAVPAPPPACADGDPAAAPLDVALVLVGPGEATLADVVQALRARPQGARTQILAVGAGAASYSSAGAPKTSTDSGTFAVMAEFDAVLAQGADDYIFDAGLSWIVRGRLAVAERRLADLDVLLRSERALRRSEQRLKLLNDLARGIASGASTREVIRRTIDEAAKLFPLSRVTYSTIDPRGKMVNVHSAGNPAMQSLAGVEADIAVAPRYLESLRRGEPMVNADVRLDPRYAELAADYVAIQAVAVIDVPIRHSEQLLGLVCLDHFEPHAWSADEVETTVAFADFLAVALSNAEADERRRASEAALRESEVLFREMANGLPAIVFLSDTLGRVTFVSQSGVEFSGLAHEELLGLGWSSLIHPEDKERAAAAIETAVAGRRGIDLEFRMRRKDGAYRWFSDRASARISSKGVFAGYVGICIDVTEKRQIDDQIQRTQKLESLGVLAGGIAHDFNNLLVGILGNAGLALMELPDAAPARGIVKRIETAALRAAELTKQLLAYSGKGRFVVQAIDLNHLVEEMGRLLETVVSKRAAIRFRPSPGIPAIEADATQIRQIVMNLITNASEAIGERDGIISVTTGVQRVDAGYLAGAPVGADAAPGLYVYLEVSDDGCGMDPATQARIFDPFFTTKFTGRGLGLAAVLGIVRGHKGAIRVYSHLGRGTTIKALFPAAPGAAAEIAEAMAPKRATARGHGTVLVVDDDMGVRLVARETCEMAGFRVEEAADGREALARFTARPDDVSAVLLDMTMPGMDGEECFRELRRVRPDVRVILSSGYNEQDATSRFAGKGLAAFIQKPYLPDELLAVLAQVTEGRKAQERG